MSKETLEALKKEADELGITYRDNIGEATLQERVDRAKANLEEEQESDPMEDLVKKQEMADPVVPNEKPKAEAKEMTEEEFAKTKEFRDAMKEATKLIRCQIMSLDPQEKDLKGFTPDVGNAYTGKICKYIPFGVNWHVPAMIIDHLRETKFLSVRMVQGEGGKEILEQRFIPKYAINVLPALTEEEGKRLQGLSEEGL